MAQRNYSVTVIQTKIGNRIKEYRWLIKASNGNVVNHFFNTRASATKSLNAFLEAVREGRLTIDGVKQEKNG